MVVRKVGIREMTLRCHGLFLGAKHCECDRIMLNVKISEMYVAVAVRYCDCEETVCRTQLC